MLNGDVNTNLKKVKLLGLGKAVDMLRVLDNSDGKPYLGTGDYKLLADIAKNIRNHWAHQGYVEYIYEKDNFNDAFSKQYKRLINDHNRLQKLYRQIEKIRIDFFNTNR